MPHNPNAAPETGNPRSDLLTTREAAVELRLSIATLERFRVTGDGPVFIKLGAGARSRVVYQRADLDIWLRAQRRQSTSQEGGDV